MNNVYEEYFASARIRQNNSLTTVNLFVFDRDQFQAIAELVAHLGWSYVSVVHEESRYGENGLIQFRKFLTAKNKCLAVVQSIPAYHPDDKVQFIVLRV